MYDRIVYTMMIQKKTYRYNFVCVKQMVYGLAFDWKRFEIYHMCIPRRQIHWYEVVTYRYSLSHFPMFTSE